LIYRPPPRRRGVTTVFVQVLVVASGHHKPVAGFPIEENVLRRM
jgi:hypothetical protein